MQTLMILRHAEAIGWQPDTDDFSRALSKCGADHAHLLAKWFCTKLPMPDEILCSPAQRTRATLAPLLSIRPELEPVTHFFPQIYNASLSTLTSVLDFAFTEAGRVLIVGHNPGCGELASELTAKCGSQRITNFPTGALVVVDFESGWEQRKGDGVLNCRALAGDLSID